MIKLQGKKILITGASSGIGRATAVLCDSLGAETILVGRNLTELNTTKSKLKNASNIFTVDLSNETEIAALAKQLPPLNGIVHGAGIVKPIPIKYLNSKSIQEIFDINFSSVVLLSSSILSNKKLEANSSVVFISSISVENPYTGGAMYTSSKAALEAFNRVFALEQASKKIRSNVISPAIVKTKIWDDILENYTAEECQKIEAQYPLGLGEPEDVANMIAFLLSDASKWITGTNIKMDGGLLL